MDNRIEQNNLLAAIVGLDSTSVFNQKGLEAYQRNFKANACRALSISFPVVYQLLGEELFNELVSVFSVQSIPDIGDWSEWGSEFPNWLAQHDISNEFPYLKDCAQLDWLHHQCERAENPTLDFDSFQWLADENAAAGTLTVNSTAVIFHSRFPIVDIWQVHQEQTGNQSEPFASIRKKLAEQEEQTALVVRHHWQAKVTALNATEQQWLNLLLAGSSLEHAIEQMPEHFSFEQWLPEAIEKHLITGFKLPSTESL